MVDDKDRIALATAPLGANNLNVITLQRAYGGKGVFKVLDTRTATFGGKKPKPVIDLIHEDGNEYYFTVNRTNSYIIGALGNKYLDEIVGKSVTLEVYETGGVGNFAFGIKVLAVK